MVSFDNLHQGKQRLLEEHSSNEMCAAAVGRRKGNDLNLKILTCVSRYRKSYCWWENYNEWEIACG